MDEEEWVVTVANGVILTKFTRRSEAVDSLLCVGLDSDLSKLPYAFQDKEFPLFSFNRWIIDRTAAYAAAYKINTAFYEACGAQGWNEMRLTSEYLREHHPDIVTICDAKRADIGNTNHGYVTAIFDLLGFDAITLHPYLGREALEPFLERSDKACIVLCRTSNRGSGELQDLKVEGRPLWQIVAEKVASEWNVHDNCMLVVGATYPEQMREIRSMLPTMTFLVPGVGAQGGDVEMVMRAGLNAEGGGLIISSSRSIIFAEDPAKAASEQRDEINAARKVVHAAD